MMADQIEIKGAFPIMPSSTQSLASEEMLAVDDGVGTTIRIDSGEVWITEEGSFIDHILCGGQEYTLDRPGRAMVAAQMESRVSLYTRPETKPPRRTALVRHPTQSEQS